MTEMTQTSANPKQSGLKKAVQYLDSWLDFRYERLQMPGFVVAISHHGELVFEKACGFANLEQQRKMMPDHIFRIASHSKTFAATLIMQMAAEKKLSIDEPVTSYLPWLSKHKDARINRITARQLMSHSAGVIRNGLNSNYWNVTESFPDQKTFESEFLKADLVFDTNVKMKYSNFGYTLLGSLLEALSAQSFADLTQEKILSPLDLKNTGVDFDESLLEHLVTGYSRIAPGKGRYPVPEKLYTNAMSAATGFYSTARDICTYFNAQIVGSNKLLDDESKKEMQRTQWKISNSPDNAEYGLGFGIDFYNQRRFIGHGGGFPGQITRTFCDPKSKTVVTVLTNCVDGEAYSMGKAIYAIIDHFELNCTTGGDSSQKKYAQLRGRFSNHWEDLDIAENGNTFVAVNPNVWFPFSKGQDQQTLKIIDEKTLQITNCDGYGGDGELIHYTFNSDGRVELMKYVGCDMWPYQNYKFETQ